MFLNGKKVLSFRLDDVNFCIDLIATNNEGLPEADVVVSYLPLVFIRYDSLCYDVLIFSSQDLKTGNATLIH